MQIPGITVRSFVILCELAFSSVKLLVKCTCLPLLLRCKDLAPVPNPTLPSSSCAYQVHNTSDFFAIIKHMSLRIWKSNVKSDELDDFCRPYEVANQYHRSSVRVGVGVTS
jgi:hypothetical protein